ncbi:proto-oncogene tyrosine-protein kinase ROS isoform X3 [Agrilus planipennis]|uniref:Tyrosine-protein kinase receptor n=1 Tax=Agrilus planipennis TaxID=224129 RepID=A0A7F5QV71_AGRPL|nr:proto-oncogene tyrosine-protein kinase ROS isoform X3 [Agrilus planipennis]
MDFSVSLIMIRVLVVLCCFGVDFLANAENLEGEVAGYCVEQCPLQNRTESNNFSNLGCQHNCSIKQCTEGCRLWKKALSSSCSRVCNASEDQSPPSGPKLFCTMGCNNAIAWYFNQLRIKLGKPPAPTLVAGSLTPTSLKLEWNFPEAKELGLTYLVQWRYEELAGNWEYYGNQSWGPYNTITVEKLQPYTKYRFRVALLLSQQQKPIVSEQSVVISTLSAGVPTSAPVIVRAVTVDCTRISVSWEPGPFPNGPILSYVLRITENAPQGYSALEDIPIERGTSVIFGGLKPNTSYTISMGMRNGVGSGPMVQTTVSTSPRPKIERSQKPILILTANHTVVQRGVNILDETKVLYSTNYNKIIRGTAIHISKQVLFISVSSRSSESILRMNLSENKNKNVTVVLSSTETHNTDFRPRDLSVDWLNNQLYILGETSGPKKTWQVTRCDLDGKGIQVAVAGLQEKPHHMEVDPCNGFLFWVTYNGLYRLDLADISNGLKHEHQPLKILSILDLGAFTIDCINYRLLVASQRDNTVMSVSLNGKEIEKMSKNIIKAKMQKVLSIATVNQLFYWTNGDELFYEAYQNATDTHYHNNLPDPLDRKYHNIIISHPDSQPIPSPVNPPTALQAIFGNDLAKTTWQAPHLLGFQGKGAWQNWTYAISVIDTNTSQFFNYTNISTTSFVIRDLKPDTEYVINAVAYTEGGIGQWSKEFRGRTLKLSRSKKYPTIFWSASEGVFISDTTGGNVEKLIPQSYFKNNQFTDIKWYNDQIYMVTNTSRIFSYNLTSRTGEFLTNIESVSSVAIDWIGKKLYWSNPKQQVIIRGNLNGFHQEPLPILKPVKELSIDPVRAYLYWSTGYEVECAHLNGADRITYYSTKSFTIQVMGLTLDFDHNSIFWIVRGSNGSQLYQAPLAGIDTLKNTPPKIFNLTDPYMQGPLCYFNNRLLWLQNDKNAIISNLTGNNMARLGGKSLYGLTTFTVMDSDLLQWPNISLETLNVLPEQVIQSSIQVRGMWDSFYIEWKPVDNVNYGTVFYEIRVDVIQGNFHDNTDGSEVQVVTKTPSIKYWKKVAPFTKLMINLRAYTYWGISPITITEIYSPSSTPSSPTDLRVYITHEYPHFEYKDVRATFRWNPPLYSNGIIKGYKIKCWYNSNGSDIIVINNSTADANQKEYYLENLLKSQKYFFQVQAFTEVGDGEISPTISVNTSDEYPVPKLLVASEDSIFIQDIDNNQNYSILHGISTPVEMAFLIKEKKLFWINKMQELFMYNMENHKKSKLVDLNNSCLSLTVDWMERSLYYLETNSITESTIYKLNLNHIDKGLSKIETILTTSSVISKIEISPFTRKLYWVEENYFGENHIMQSELNGSDIRPFFVQRSHNKRSLESEEEESCNCPVYPNVEKTFTVDHSDSKTKPAIIFIDSDTHAITSSDKDGCHCEILANHQVVGDSFPLQKLKSDFSNLYWTNKTQGHLYSLRKKELNVTKGQEISDAHDMQIYGSHMQPYPEGKCLVPEYKKDTTISLVHATSHSLTLAMPEVTLNKDCENVSQATVEYTIHYKQYHENDLNECFGDCSEIKTLEKVLTIDGLKPFSKYSFWVSVKNYFMELMKTESQNRHSIIIQTSAGAPSKPRNVSATVLNPNMAEIVWAPPEKLNGEFVSYEIHWQTESTHGIRQKGEQEVKNLQKHVANDTLFTSTLSKLAPNETYSIWIRAKSQTNESFNDSDSIIVKTFPEPSEISLLNATATTLQIIWKPYTYAEKVDIQYSLLASNVWKDISEDRVEYDGNDTIIIVDDLKPKTQYKFRMKLLYPLYSEPHYWPHDVRFIFETLGDRPSPPGRPYLQLKSGKFIVMWESPKDNGAVIELYKLEVMELLYYNERRKRSTDYDNKAAIEEFNYTWTEIYNGTEPAWEIAGLKEKNHKYVFRASALNMYGWSAPSNESDMYDPVEFAKLNKQDPMTLIIIAITVPLAFCIVSIICFVCLIFSGKLQCAKDKKSKQQLILSPRPDVELATLRELPRRGIHSTNILYVPNQPLLEDATMLPHIRRDCITLTKFLGSGAFGEVFEGKARGILANGAEVKVAVKALRKGASDSEKCEFLQEAQLMSHFKHEHILQLLGVCLDNDPQFIIMELMEGGDLLTYLRSSRNPSLNTSSLSLLDLLKMCVDVAKGCKYLEEMHFVHRDLACRNCLVSSTNRETRIVKIGDFGLARDIYKNDYYRKEGEGLLPVRWMAPESLVDGVFTSLSDAWAFGVLLWEIMTLGQQPYPARNNLEVLHYVKTGGRLGKPQHCPETLYDLMLKCWLYEPERRPSFKNCLYVLEDLHTQKKNDPVTGAHEGQYISTVEEKSSWKSDGSGGDINKERTPFLQNLNGNLPSEGAQDNIPKYLELIYDSDSQVEDARSNIMEDRYLDKDGYEIPRTDNPKEGTVSVTNKNVNKINNENQML